MGQKIVVGPVNKGLRNDVTPFNVDNDAFPTLINAYQWRGRVKRKRGTGNFTRLKRQIVGPKSGLATSYYTNIGNTSGTGSFGPYNLISNFSLGTNAVIATSTGSSLLSIKIGAQTFTDNGLGVLSNGAGGTGTIDYATGIFSLQTNPALLATPVFIVFSYYPALPGLGLEPFVQDASDFPGELGFDTTYSYNIILASPYPSYSVSYYYNTSSPVTKTDWTPVIWNLADYQQIWTTNYQGALWATAGIRSPFDATKIGMQYSAVTNVAAPTATTVVITVTGANLVVGDWVFLNEFDPAIITGINFQTGYVSAGSAPGAITITIPTATMAGAGGATTSGIVQYLTNSSDTTRDCIRWYNGSPISNAVPPSFIPNQGWVNFCPPLLSGAAGTFSISDLPPAQYYLAGARMIVPFKDRLLFFGPVVQTSTPNSQVYLQDTVIYSQNGTPYYTASFPGVPSTTTIYTPQVVPTNQTAQPSSFWEDLTGFGGFISAGYARPITSVSINEDALIVGFADRQARLLYTGNDIVPFNFYIINSELGSDSTFSTITLDRGVLSVGGRGIILTSQIASQRVDLDIPDEVFEVSLLHAGARRICAQRDFINEWIYFTYPSNLSDWNFPTRTLQYNYRDHTWSLFNESYTTYGTIRKQTGFTWQTVGNTYASWNAWSDPWDAGESSLEQPEVIAANMQGFVITRADGTSEAPSLYIKTISGTTITSPNHCLSPGDFIMVSGVQGTVGTFLNGLPFEILTTPTADTFTIDILGTGTYTGEGLITKMYVPYIQTRQFPVSWEMGRKTRLGPQMYLFTKTTNAQITLLIFLSQNSVNPYNTGTIFPDITSINNSLIYSTILYTCPEGTNLGLTPANINLQMVTGSEQQQIWHRMNTSLLGDTVQVGFTLSKGQMLGLDDNGNPICQFAEIEFHSMVLDVQTSQVLA